MQRTSRARRTILRPDRRYGKRDFIAWRLSNLVLNLIASKGYREVIRDLIADGVAYREFIAELQRRPGVER